MTQAANMCRTSTATEVAVQAGTRVRACGAARASESDAVRREAAALHYLRTQEEVCGLEEVDVAAVTRLLRLEALGMSACGDCCRCAQGEGCKRVANRDAARRGVRGAQWAEEAEGLLGREFQVCGPFQRAGCPEPALPPRRPIELSH